jgi:hypothetical protein
VSLSDSCTAKELSNSAKLDDLTKGLPSVSDACMDCTSNLRDCQQDQSIKLESFQNQHDEQDLELQSIQNLVTVLESKLLTIEKCVKEFDKRFMIIFPILKEARQTKPVIDHSTTDALKLQLQDLSKKVDILEQTAWQQIHTTSSPTSVTHPVTLEAEIKDIRHQMNILQHWIVGGGVKTGSKVFQSFEDVQVWVKAELPIQRYGLFVNAVSILDFFSCLGHIDAENQVSTLHNTNKAGFTSIPSRHSQPRQVE